MKNQNFEFVCYLAIFGFLFLITDVAFAQVGGIGGGDLASRVNGLTSQVINIVLPAVSVLGLVYAAILSATGDQSAKQRMVLILFTSVIGFIAPIIINWLKSASGTGGF